MSKTVNHSSLFASHHLLLNLHQALNTQHSTGASRVGGSPDLNELAFDTQHSALILLIGLPGSGKSTLAKQLLVECPQMQLISTDVIRGQLFGSEVIQGPWLLIWREVEQQLQQVRTVGKTAIFDATNAQRRHRREIITLARNLGFTHITGIWVNTPVWLCLARNQKRDRQVPEEIILRMHRQLRDAPPSLEEGLDCLIFSQEAQEYGNCARVLSENHT